MRRTYKFICDCRVVMVPANAKGAGKAGETELSHHTQTVEFTGDPGGKVGQYGDADHLAQLADTCEASAKISTRAAVFKAHEFLTTQHPDTAPAQQAPEHGLETEDTGPQGSPSP